MSKPFTAFLNDENESVLTVEQLQKFSKPEQEQIRQWCMRDTWFLSQRVLRQPYSLPLQPCHRDFCCSLVQPNPDLPIQQWDATKERALLCFRGFGKTTLSSVHIVQCILCCPNIRILLVGGVVAHAERKMRAVVDLFNTPIIEYLFPDFYNASVKAGAFTTSARTATLREATISCASFRSTNASGHYELVSCDDAANDANQGTSAAVEKSLVKFDDLAPLVEPDCYIDYIGVRTDAADIPSQMFARSIANGTPLGGCEIPVFTVKEGINKKDKLKLNLSTDVDYAWPQRWNEKTLQRVYALPNFLENYLLEIFEAEPEPEIQPVTPELLRSCITKSVDYLGDVAVINADLSRTFTTNEERKDFCGLVGGYWNFSTKILTVTRLLHEKFSSDEDFLRQMRAFYADFCLNFTRVRFRVEANQSEQRFEQSFAQLKMQADFIPSIDRKYERVSVLWDAIRSGKVKFADELSKSSEWQILVNQICYFSGNERQHDDAVDSLAQLFAYCQTITTAEPNLNVPDFGDDAINPFPVNPARPCNTVKIRRPDTMQPHIPLSMRTLSMVECLHRL